MVLTESIPRQVDKKSGGPRGERGLGFLRRRKEQTFFFSTFLSLNHIKCFFFPLSSELIRQQTTQFQLCTRDYKTTTYPA